MTDNNKSLKIYDTLRQQLRLFEPIVAGQVSFYVCGVTVYDYCHMGHARAYVAFDMMRRYLLACGYQVKYVQNFTDIDDKIISRAQADNRTVDDVVSANIDAYFEDMDALGILRADQYPRATAYIAQMITMIQKLVDTGYAYVTDHHDVCFSVDAFSEYGQLSKKVLDELESGSRVIADQAKKNPFDFVLWKPAKPGEPSWESPWGKGRPGWHIECSAMVLETLGKTIDIHGGGADLVFPHHENEIAQSQCYTGKPFVNYWVHNGFVTLKDEKMSKSIGNIFTVRDVLKQYSGSVLRFFLLKVHYRSPIQYSEAGLVEAQQAFRRLVDTFKSVKQVAVDRQAETDFETIRNRFHEAMSDDFNTAAAIGILFDLNKLIHKTQSGTGVLKELGDILGIFYDLPSPEDTLPEDVLNLIEMRSQAKKDRQFDVADQIRDELVTQYGIILEDTSAGVRWKKK